MLLAKRQHAETCCYFYDRVGRGCRRKSASAASAASAVVAVWWRHAWRHLWPRCVPVVVNQPGSAEKHSILMTKLGWKYLMQSKFWQSLNQQKYESESRCYAAKVAAGEHPRAPAPPPHWGHLKESLRTWLGADRDAIYLLSFRQVVVFRSEARTDWGFLKSFNTIWDICVNMTEDKEQAENIVSAYLFDISIRFEPEIFSREHFSPRHWNSWTALDHFSEFFGIFPIFCK